MDWFLHDENNCPKRCNKAIYKTINLNSALPFGLFLSTLKQDPANFPRHLHKIKFFLVKL